MRESADSSIRGGSEQGGGCIRVLVVDGCSLGVIGINAILKSRWKDARVSHARCSDEARSQLLAGTWDIVLIEIELAGQSGLELIIWARMMLPSVRLLAMSWGEETVQGMEALSAGSAGFFHRGGSEENLLKAVEQVLGGRHYISPRLAATLARRVNMPSTSGKDLDQVLSPREAHILQALAHGEHINEIGASLAISPKTVSTYRRRILEKMHFQNDADIVKYFWAKGRMAPPSKNTEQPL